MKITKSKLKQIIQEEMENVVEAQRGEDSGYLGGLLEEAFSEMMLDEKSHSAHGLGGPSAAHRAADLLFREIENIKRRLGSLDGKGE